jgi:hypothetical protein
MDFNTEELLLIKILLSFGPKIEECHEKTFKYNFDFNKSIFDLEKTGITSTKDGKQKIYQISAIGMYNKKTEEFIWSSGLNNSISVFIKNNSHTYGDYKIYEKLLRPIVIINEKYYKALIYLFIIIINNINNINKKSPFILSNLVIFSDPTKTVSIFTLIELGIDCTIDFKQFYKLISLHNEFGESKELRGYSDFNNNFKVKLIKDTNILSRKIIKKSHSILDKNLLKNFSNQNNNKNLSYINTFFSEKGVI